MRRGRASYCAFCDSSFYLQAAEEARNFDHYCSRECYMAARVENRRDTYPRIGAIHEHRLIAERVLNRSLKAGEVVHHIDGDKINNDPTNLAVFPSQSMHFLCHLGKLSASDLDRHRLVRA